MNPSSNLNLEPVGFLSLNEERRILVELLRTNDEFYILARKNHLSTSLTVWNEILTKFPNTLGYITHWYVNHKWNPAQQSMEFAVFKM